MRCMKVICYKLRSNVLQNTCRKVTIGTTQSYSKSYEVESNGS